MGVKHCAVRNNSAHPERSHRILIILRHIFAVLHPDAESDSAQSVEKLHRHIVGNHRLISLAGPKSKHQVITTGSNLVVNTDEIHTG